MKDIIELNIQDLKNIANEIIESELTQTNLKNNILPLTFAEYYNNYALKGKHNLIKKVINCAVPLIAGGLNDLEGNIVIFVNHYNTIEKVENKIFSIANACYHEIRHSFQKTFDSFSYEGFLRDVDISLYTIPDYILEHDNYSIEIGANLYGVKKAKEYLRTKYPDLYNNYKEEIDKQEKKYQLDYMTYDASYNIDRLIQMIKSKNNKPKNEKKLTDISPVLEIFLNEDASFKTFNEIIQNDRFKNLDKKIIHCILSSESFLKQINMDQLSIEEMEIINESLQYTASLYKIQSDLIKQSLNEKNIEYQNYLKSQKALIYKIARVECHYLKILFNALNSKRDNKQKQEHMESIPTYLEENNQLIKQRKNKGYLSITLFYIISAVISILTIICLIYLKTN